MSGEGVSDKERCAEIRKTSYSLVSTRGQQSVSVMPTFLHTNHENVYCT